jgi:hypothetical protein
MTKLTSVKSTAKQLTLVAAVTCVSLIFTKSALAEAIQVKTEPLEQRNIEQPHLDVLLNMEKALTKLSGATKAYNLIVKYEQAEFEQCKDDLCKGTRIGKSASGNEAYGKASLEYAEEMRDIETNQMQYIIDTMQIKGDSYLASFTQKRAEFFDSYDQVLPQIQALNMKSSEDFQKLTSDQQLALEKFGVQIDRNLDDLTIMMKEINVIDNTRVLYETSKQGLHDHANSYELRSDKLDATAFKQTRRKDLLALTDYQNISFMDLNTIASTLSALPASSDMSFIPYIDCCSSPDKEVGIIKTQRSGGTWLFDNTRDSIESIRNFKRN